MGFHLSDEILRHFPADMSPGERILLATIAHFADDRTRIARAGHPRLVAATGLDTETIRRTVKKWEQPTEKGGRGWKVRVPLTTGRDGREVYACRGHEAEWSVPHLAPHGTLIPTTCGTEQAPTVGEEAPQSGEERPTPTPTTTQKGPTSDRAFDEKGPTSGMAFSSTNPPKGPTSRMAFPSTDPHKGPTSDGAFTPEGPTSDRAFDEKGPTSDRALHKVKTSLPRSESPTSLWDRLGLSEDEKKWTIRIMRVEKGIRNPEAALQTMIENGTIHDIVASARQAVKNNDTHRTPVEIHHFEADPHGFCARPGCGLPRGNSRHDHPDSPPPPTTHASPENPPASTLEPSNRHRPPLAAFPKL